MANGNGAATTTARPQGIEHRALKCLITPDERDERGSRLAEVDMTIAAKRAEIAGLKESTKLAVKDLTGDVEALEKEQAALSRTIKTGEETREVACQWHDDNGKPERFLLRTDDRIAWPEGTHADGEVHRRPLDHHEQQQSMFAGQVPADERDDADGEDSDDGFDDGDDEAAGDTAH